MDGAPLNYPDDIGNGILSLYSSQSGAINDQIGEPVKCKQSVFEESIKMKDLLLDSLNNQEVIPIDNNEYRNKDIDEIIQKIDSFGPEFQKLQDELDELFKLYVAQIGNTQKNILKIENSIRCMSELQGEYNLDESVKDIIEKLNNYSRKIGDNDKLIEVKKEYIEKRKELNSYLYFIQKLNKWNVGAMCPICITDQIDTYCNPCGHTACKKCLDRNRGEDNRNAKCPICRDYIMEMRKLYLI